MKLPTIVIFLSWLLVGSSVARAQNDGAKRPPNIVFILCDDLGVNDLHCYGREDHRTPNLDRLATQGTRFTSAYCAQAICSPSRAAILTGKAPARLHLTTYLPGRPNRTSQKVIHPEIQMQVGLGEKMLPQYFKTAGYATAAIGKWHVGGEGFGPREHGFDFATPGQPRTKPSLTEGSKSEYALTAAAEGFLEQNQGRPFLLYLAHHTPHIPYAALPEQIARHEQAFEPVYAAVIETLDDAVGRILAKLEELNLAENTILIFTSDNGGLHLPEGGHARVTHNSPYRAGKGYSYEGGLRVPLIVRWPGRVPAARVIETPVINTDWLPTLLELAGQQIPAGLDGVSMAPLLLNSAPAIARPLFWHFPHYTNQGSRPHGAVRDGDWMLIEFYDEDTLELYNLATDVRETNNVVASNPERVKAMQAALAKWRVSVSAQQNLANPNVDPALYEKIYRDVDVSRFDPLNASPAEWARIKIWRKDMDGAPRVGTAP